MGLRRGGGDFQGTQSGDPEAATYPAGKGSRLCAPDSARFVRPFPRTQQGKGTNPVIRSIGTFVAPAAVALLVGSGAQAAPIFASESYDISLIGATAYNGTDADYSQGLVFDDSAGSAGGTFTTTAAPAPVGAGIAALPATELFFSQVDSPQNSQVFNSGAGTSIRFAIDDDGLLQIVMSGNLGAGGTNLGAVSIDLVVTGLNPLAGASVSSVDLLSSAPGPNSATSSIVGVTGDGFTLRLSDPVSFDGNGGIFSYQITAVPEPGTAMLLATGLTALAVRRRRLH